MAVKTLNEDDSKLTLELDNGDYKKFKEVMDKWDFKDYQSLLRFAVSVFLLSEDKKLTTKIEGKQQEVAPVDELLKSR